MCSLTYKTEIIEKDIYDEEPLFVYQKQINELLSLTKNDLDIAEIEKDNRMQEILKYLLPKQYRGMSSGIC